MLTGLVASKAFPKIPASEPPTVGISETIKNDFFTKNRVKTALRAGRTIYFFVDENDA